MRRRLAYLVREEALFSAIDRIEYKDSVGKLVVYYVNERKGRLFDYIEGAEGFDKFIFPPPTARSSQRAYLTSTSLCRPPSRRVCANSATCSRWSAWLASPDGALTLDDKSIACRP